MTVIEKVKRNLDLLRASVGLKHSPQIPAWFPVMPPGKTLPITTWETIASIIPAQEFGKFRIKKKPLKKGSYLDMGDVMGYDYAFFLQDVYITVLEEHGYIEPCKWQVWMSDSPAEYYAMWELNARVQPSRVLIGGLGLGILTNIIANRKDITKITVVELSPEIITTIKPHIPAWVEIVRADFIDYFHRAELVRDQYDTIIVDIFSGNREKDKPILEDVQMVAEDYTFEFPESLVLYWKYQRDKESELLLHWAIMEQRKK